MRGVSKHFGGTHALIDAGIDVGAGEIVALLGENGAGKSTLIKILAGVHPLDAAAITYRGHDAIARALAADAELLVLDEPTASLPADEVARLFTALRRLRARGVGMIYVSHRLDEVFEIADRMVILRDGRVVCERAVKDISPEECILRIVGREPSQVFRRPARHEGAARLVFERVTTDCAGPLDCRIRAGEVVGLVGLRGAGQESIARAVFGLPPGRDGRVGAG